MATESEKNWIDAVRVDPDYRTMQEFTGDGSTDTFEVNFTGGYLNSSHVKGEFLDEAAGVRTDLELELVGLNTFKVRPVPTLGSIVTLYRDTPKEVPLLSFVDGAMITAPNLDRNAKQAVFAVAEMLDRFSIAYKQVELAEMFAEVARNAASSAQANRDYIQVISDKFGLSSNMITYMETIQGRVQELSEQVEGDVNSAEAAALEASMYKDTAGVDALRAERAREGAEAIRDSKGTYFITGEDPDGTIAGLAGTTEGGVFRVAQGVGSAIAFIYYRVSSASAVPVAVLGRSDSRIDELELAVSEINSKMWRTDIAGVAIAFVDASGNRTWLEVDANTGGPTDWSKRLLTDLVSSELITPTNIEGILSTTTDAEGRRSWLEANDTDGGPTEWSKKLIKDAISLEGSAQTPLYYPVRRPFVQGTWEVKPNDVYLNHKGDLCPVLSDISVVSGWGSSTLVQSQMNTKLRSLFAEFGATYNDLAKPGELAQQTAGRLGSIPFQVRPITGIIPESGGVLCEVRGLPEGHYQMSSLRDYKCTLAGAVGRMGYNAVGGMYQFFRTESGPTIAVGEFTPAIPDAQTNYRHGLGLLVMGKNNGLAPEGSDLNDPVETFRIIHESYMHFTGILRRVLVMGSFVSRYLISAREDRLVLETNRLCAEKYGNMYIDIQKFITSPDVWVWSGITPTQQDLDAQAAGRKAPSLSLDNAHLNGPGTTAVVNGLIRPKLLELGWYNQEKENVK